MKSLLPITVLAMALVGCGSSSDDSATTPGTPPASLSGANAAPGKGGSKAMIAPAMTPSSTATPPPLEAGSALKGK